MTLVETLLQKLSDWTPTAGRQELSLIDPESGWSATLTADRKDEIGCLLWELSLRRAEPVAGDVAAWADGVVQRVTGLLEPLKVIEVDASRNEALLRSDAPQSRDGKLFYYELLLVGTASARFRRYAGAAEAKREQVAFAMTHESIAKLVGDITAALVS